MLPVESGTEGRVVRGGSADVARAPRRDAHGKCGAGCALHRLDHLAHGIAVAVAAIQRQAFPPATEMVERADVGLRKVADVNEIANTGAIRRIIVVSEDLHSRPLSGRRLAGYLAEVGRVGGDLPGPADRVGAGHVEVSQDEVATAVRGG